MVARTKAGDPVWQTGGSGPLFVSGADRVMRRLKWVWPFAWPRRWQLNRLAEAHLNFDQVQVVTEKSRIIMEALKAGPLRERGGVWYNRAGRPVMTRASANGKKPMMIAVGLILAAGAIYGLWAFLPSGDKTPAKTDPTKLADSATKTPAQPIQQPAAQPTPSCSAPWACRMCVAPTALRSFRSWTCASRWISMPVCAPSAHGPACRHRCPTRVRPRSTWCWCARAPKACSTPAAAASSSLTPCSTR